ncbi:hypothetical protein [Paraburkholderia atlantica]|uniref:hypothetical protein n=1 Tax=Paraburkholderia atlantica TaxID=2654982 RepID=UPI003D22D2D4
MSSKQDAFREAVRENDRPIFAWTVLEVRDFQGVGLDALQHPVTHVMISIAIQQFDPTALRGVTSSGRVYQLVGPRGCSGDGQYICERRCSFNGITSYTDVTGKLLAEKE